MLWIENLTSWKIIELWQKKNGAGKNKEWVFCLPEFVSAHKITSLKLHFSHVSMYFKNIEVMGVAQILTFFFFFDR